jgi:hypothetical protein
VATETQYPGAASDPGGVRPWSNAANVAGNTPATAASETGAVAHPLEGFVRLMDGVSTLSTKSGVPWPTTKATAVFTGFSVLPTLTQLQGDFRVYVRIEDNAGDNTTLLNCNTFDFSAIPAGSTIDDVTVTITASSVVATSASLFVVEVSVDYTTRSGAKYSGRSPSIKSPIV